MPSATPTSSRAAQRKSPQYDIDPDKLDAEVARFDNAIKATRKELEQLRGAIPENAPTELGAFISLHLMLLTDVTLSRDPSTFCASRNQRRMGMKLQSDKLAAQFDSIDDDYLRERKQDMLQVVRRIHNNLVGQSNEINLAGNLFDDTVLIAHDLSPADTVLFKEQHITAFVTDAGGPTSHTAILGRSLDIPSVIGLHNARKLITENEIVIVDGINGILIIDPDEVVLSEYRRLAREYRSHKRELNKSKNRRHHGDGINIELLANIESAEDIKALHNFGADGVGLFRSEFLYLNRDNMPTEDEQYEVYAGIVKKLKGKNITIRTVDLGVDKIRAGSAKTARPTAASTRARPDRHPFVPRRAGHVPHPNACHSPRRRPRPRAHDVADDYVHFRSAPMPYPSGHGPTPTDRTRRNLGPVSIGCMSKSRLPP